MKIHSRLLEEIDFKNIKELLLKDGINEWNYITEESINNQFQLIKEGKASVILAEKNEIIGFAILIHEEFGLDIYRKYGDLASTASINDVVVSKDHSGKGIGSKLLNECISVARQLHFHTVYIERHEENLASAGMMRKSGFQIIETFYDSKKRFSGSKNTTVLKKNT
jgi:GNAT superfamily N-acetyltransferase